MAAYPSSPPFRYPVTRRLEFQTEVFAGKSGVEQRSALHSGRESWTLSYGNLKLSERDTLLSAFETAKGNFDDTLSFTFEGTTYTGVHFADQSLRFTQSGPRKWSGTVNLKKHVRGYDVGSLPTDFPLLTSGARTQYPFSHERSFDNDVVETEGGRYAYYNRAAGLRVWSAGGTVLTATDALAIWDMFRLARGKLSEFAFTDPDSLVRYPHCRFESDTIEWQYTEYGVNSITVAIHQLS